MNIDLNKRKTDILYFILNSPTTVALSELMVLSHREVGSRTITNDIRSINDYLSSQDLPPLVISDNLYVSFSGDSEQRKAAMELLFNQQDFYQYKLSPEERARVIVCHLINSDDFVSLQELCAVVVVSRGTLYADLKNCKELAAHYGLTITHTPRKGYRIEGSEYQKRRAIALLYRRWSDRNLNPNQAFVTILDQTEMHFGFTFTDQSYIELLRYIKVSVQRHMSGHRLEQLTHSTATDPSVPSVGQYMWSLLQASFPLNPDGNEEYALTLQYNASEKLRPSASLPVAGFAREIAARLLQMFSTLLETQLAPSDEQLELFESYLESLCCKQPDTAPHEEHMTALPPELAKYHLMVKSSLPVIQLIIGSSLSQKHALQLTLFLGAFALNSLPHVPAQNAYVICGDDAGDLEYLCAQLRVLFNMNIEQIYSFHTLQHASDKLAPDIVITTIPVKDTFPDAIYVNPSLSAENAEKLQAVLLQRRLHAMDDCLGRS